MDNSPLATPTGPSAPPPPSEVKLRTMRADLDAMTKSGGGLPHFQNIKVAGLSTGKEHAASAPETAAKASGNKNISVMVLVAAAALALGIIGYFGYTLFFAGGRGVPAAPQTPQAPIGHQPAVNPVVQSSSTVPAAATPFAHVSLFVTRPAAEKVALTLASLGTAASATDLATFNQKLTAALASTNQVAPKNQTSSLIEVNIKGSDGSDLSINDILSHANAQIIVQQLLAAHFNPDATFFVYRDKNGAWPGYVLSLKPGENWLFSSADTKTLESSPNIGNLFLQDPGKPSADGFTDSMLGGTTVRVLPFFGASVPTYFVYGWAKNVLIVSTSQGGFTEAASRL